MEAAEDRLLAVRQARSGFSANLLKVGAGIAFLSDSEEIRMLLTDIVMAEISGKKLADEAKALPNRSEPTVEATKGSRTPLWMAVSAGVAASALSRRGQPRTGQPRTTSDTTNKGLGATKHAMKERDNSRPAKDPCGNNGRVRNDVFERRTLANKTTMVVGSRSVAFATCLSTQRRLWRSLLWPLRLKPQGQAS
jgi:hypothetical protein